MNELIKAKMSEHVQEILRKETITNEDYLILANALSRIEQNENGGITNLMAPMLLSLLLGGI